MAQGNPQPPPSSSSSTSPPTSSPSSNFNFDASIPTFDRIRSMVQNILNPFPPSSLPSILHSLNPIRLINLILNSLYSLIHSPNTHRSILGSIIITLTITLSLAISVIGYISFYWTYLPHIGFRLPVWLQYGEARVPYALLDFSSLPTEISIDQAYDVNLQLTVPTNDRNMELGNFMVTLSLVSAPPSNTTLHRTSRHASLVYEPGVARFIHGFKYIRTMFFLSSPASVQQIRIPLLEQRIIQPRSWGKRGKIAYAKLQIGRQDAYSPGPTPHPTSKPPWGELQVYHANLVFDAHLEGVRWVLYHHPYISFAFFTTLFLFTELFAVLLTWVVVIYRSPPTDDTKPTVSIKTEDGASSSENHPSRRFLDNERSRGVRGPISLGMTQVDESGSEDEHRAVDDGDEAGNEVGVPAIKTEDDEDEEGDGVLLGGSDTTATGRSAFGSGTLTSRTTRTSDSQSYL